MVMFLPVLQHKEGCNCFLLNQLIKQTDSWYSIRVGMGTEREVHVIYRVPYKFQLRVGSGMIPHG